MNLRYFVLALLCCLWPGHTTPLHADDALPLVIQTGHNMPLGNSIQALAYSPDGTLVASGTGGDFADNGELILWSGFEQHQAQVWAKEALPAGINALAWSFDSRLLAVAANDGLRIFNRTGAGFTAHLTFDDNNPESRDAVTRLGWVGRSTQEIAVALARGTILVCNLATNQRRILLETRDQYFQGDLKLSPGGNFLALSTEAGIQLIDPLTGTHKQTLTSSYYNNDLEQQVAFRAQTLAWSPDNRLLAAYDNGGRFALWNAATGKLLRTRFKEGFEQIYYFTIDNNGNLTWPLTAEDGTQKFQDKSRFQIYYDKRPVNHIVNTLSPDGKKWVISPSGKYLNWLDAMTRRSLAGSIGGLNQWANAVAWSPDGKLLAIGYGRRTSDNTHGEICVFDTQTGTLIRSLIAIKDSDTGDTGVNGITFSPDGRYLAANAYRLSDSYASLRFWDTKTFQATHEIPLDIASAVKIKFSNDGKTLFCGTQSGEVLVWKSVDAMLRGKTAPDLQLDAEASETRSGENLVIGVGVSPDKSLLIAGADGRPPRLSAWDLKTGQLRGDLPVRGAVQSVLFSHDGQRFWTGDDVGDVKEWDTQTLQLRRTLQESGPFCGSLALSGDEKTLFAARHNDIGVYSLSDGTLRTTLSGAPVHLNEITLSPNGKLLAGADESGEVHLWSTVTFQPAVCFLRVSIERDKRGFLSTNSIALTPDGHYKGTPRIHGFLRWRSKPTSLKTSAQMQSYNTRGNRPEQVKSALNP